jgi:tetratricopeptide (TPR) repeat protein
MTLAWSSFLQVLEVCPFHLGARIGLGYVDLREGRDDSARERLEAVSEAVLENVDALTGLGILAWRRGDLPQVGNYFTRVLEVDPGNVTAEDYLSRLPTDQLPVQETPDSSLVPALLGTEREEADQAWNRGDTEAAARLYEAILLADPTDDRALHRSALMAAWDERYDEALSLFDELLEANPDNPEALVDRARILAWKGELGDALLALDGVLEQNPTYLPAMEARAQVQSWSGDYSEALTSYDQLVGISDDPTGILLAQARTLGWASRVDESLAVYDSLLAVSPDNLEARLGQARLLAYADEIEEAIGRYDGILADHSGNLEAQRGRARALIYGGYLIAGEEAWRAALDDAPGDLVSRIGLAHTLRWQGRNELALAVLEGAEPSQKEKPEYLEQLQWIRTILAPRGRLSIVREGDSDQNAMTTFQVTSGWSPAPGWAVRGDVYTRDLSQSTIDLSRSSWGLNLQGSYQMEPGWVFSAGAGGTRTNGSGASSFPSLRAEVSTPARNPLIGSLTLRVSPLDATAQLVEQGVRVDQVDFSGRWTPAPGWQVTGSAGVGSYKGAGSNQRVHLNARVDRRLAGGATVGISHRYFGFEKDLNEFYFDPDYFGLTEATARWTHVIRSVGVLLEGASGAQKIASDGRFSMAVRASARFSYSLAPGREVSLSGGYSSAGLQSFNTGDSDYSYTAVILGGSWVF